MERPPSNHHPASYVPVTMTSNEIYQIDRVSGGNFSRMRNQAIPLVGAVREPPGRPYPGLICPTTGRFTNRPYENREPSSSLDTHPLLCTQETAVIRKTHGR